jgi:hypothetical protein
VWTLAELREVAGANGALAAAVWGATEAGNYEEEATRERTGANILHRTRTLGEHATELGLSEGELASRLESARRALLSRRSERVRPLRDDKILTDWNGLMIAGTARAGWVLGDEGVMGQARRAEAFVWQSMWHEEALLHRYRDGEAALDANLDDYAFLAWGEIELHQATQDPTYLERAVRLTSAMLDRFWDADNGGLFFSPAGRDDLIVRMKEIGDGALPSGSGVAMYNLVRLARITGRTEYDERAGALADACSRQIAARPSGAAFFLIALDLAIGPSQELVVVGDAGDPATTALLDVAREGFHPRLVVVHRPVDDASRLLKLAPVLREFTPVEGRPAAYLCHGFACERPVTTPGDLRALLSA